MVQVLPSESGPQVGVVNLTPPTHHHQLVRVPVNTLDTRTYLYIYEGNLQKFLLSFVSPWKIRPHSLRLDGMLFTLCATVLCTTMKVTCSGTNPDICEMWLTSLSGNHLFSEYDASHTQFVELFTVWIHVSSHLSVVFLCSFEVFFCYKCSFGIEELG